MIAITRRQSSGVVSCSGAIVPGNSWPNDHPTPALFTRMSTPPWAATAASTTVAAPSSVDRSAATTVPLPPAASTVASAASSVACVRAAPTTVAPSRANSSYVARPMPVLDPVISATLPSRRPMGVPPCAGAPLRAPGMVSGCTYGLTWTFSDVCLSSWARKAASTSSREKVCVTVGSARTRPASSSVSTSRNSPW